MSSRPCWHDISDFRCHERTHARDAEPTSSMTESGPSPSASSVLGHRDIENMQRIFDSAAAFELNVSKSVVFQGRSDGRCLPVFRHVSDFSQVKVVVTLLRGGVD